MLQSCLLVPTASTAAAAPKGLRTDGEKGLHYLLRDFAQLLLDESSSSGWGQVVREARAEERRAATEEAAMSSGNVSLQPLLDVGNRLVSHLISVSSCPEGKTAVLRANVVLVAGLVGLFGDVIIEQTDDSGETFAVEGHRTGRCAVVVVVCEYCCRGCCDGSYHGMVAVVVLLSVQAIACLRHLSSVVFLPGLFASHLTQLQSFRVYSHADGVSKTGDTCKAEFSRVLFSAVVPRQVSLSPKLRRSSYLNSQLD